MTTIKQRKKLHTYNSSHSHLENSRQRDINKTLLVGANASNPKKNNYSWFLKYICINHQHYKYIYIYIYNHQCFHYIFNKKVYMCVCARACVC